MYALTKSTNSRALRWDAGNYDRLTAATYTPPYLTLSFANGEMVQVLPKTIAPGRARPAAWERPSIDADGVLVIPADGEPLEIPGDAIRRLTDPGFAAYWAWADEYTRRAMGARLLRLRRERGFTLRALAKLVGVPYQSIQRLEHGKHDPGLSLVGRILAALDRSWADLNATGEEREAFTQARYEAFPEDRAPARVAAGGPPHRADDHQSY